MGRVNSRIRLGIAEWFGCDTADGTYLAYGPDKNLPKFLSWLRDLGDRPSLLAGALDTPPPGRTPRPPPPRTAHGAPQPVSGAVKALAPPSRASPRWHHRS
ncbi:hypothetical protein ABZ646_16705 [Streptomyces sp. NPDC007162]|uniref:hypothetical protein n=1 Tax=Streptomyces sp. NPDC007162 TaxID=3156917 RepID=UPI0033D345FF